MTLENEEKFFKPLTPTLRAERDQDGAQVRASPI